jgi:hypothetical protein
MRALTWSVRGIACVGVLVGSVVGFRFVPAYVAGGTGDVMIFDTTARIADEILHGSLYVGAAAGLLAAVALLFNLLSANESSRKAGIGRTDEGRA